MTRVVLQKFRPTSPTPTSTDLQEDLWTHSVGILNEEGEGWFGGRTMISPLHMYRNNKESSLFQYSCP